MHGLGIPTTRALCVTGSDAAVWREQKETAAVVTRVAPSFIRFGHFEHFCHTHQHTELKALADFVIEHFYPECQTSTAWDSNPYTALIAAVTERTAKMIARWQSVGFCHGVMNTDNMSILGLTLDYGPFQFLDGYDPAHICNHSDTQGRYAFHKQPSIAYWNLFCLGQALMPLVKDQDNAVAALETFKAHYEQAFAKAMAHKLGFAEAHENQRSVIEEAYISLRIVATPIFRRVNVEWTKKSGRFNGTTANESECYECFKKGHYARDCPIRLARRRDHSPARRRSRSRSRERSSRRSKSRSRSHSRERSRRSRSRSRSRSRERSRRSLVALQHSASSTTSGCWMPRWRRMLPKPQAGRAGA
jgi:uncharacterized protein YdiU (UPF0061 family)